MEIQIVLTNRYGEFKGRKAQMSEENYQELVKMVRTFYLSGGFELTLEDETFVVFPPDIVKESILQLVKISD
jgi:hypothetical protein